MPAPITSHLAIAAIRLKQLHPHASARHVLDACLRDRTGALGDFGRDIEPVGLFARLLAEAFGCDLDLSGLSSSSHAEPCPQRMDELRRIWRSEVLPRFAAAYGLEP